MLANMAFAKLICLVLTVLTIGRGVAGEVGFTFTPLTCVCGGANTCKAAGAFCVQSVTETVEVRVDGVVDPKQSGEKVFGGPGNNVCYTETFFSQRSVSKLDTLTPTDCPVPCPSGVCGDPVITGYDGRAFDFKGEADKYFNLISEPKHLVNAKFVDAELKNEVGNFMGEVGFKYMNSTVKAAINREGSMTVEVNGEEQPFAQVTKDLGDGLLVEIEPHFPQLGHVVVITTPLMVFRIEAIKPFEDEVTGHNRGYLNVLSILRDHPSGLHGILGQTAYTTEYYPLNDMQFHGDGEEMDYEVSSLFAHDHKFNTFTFTGLTWSTTDAARRLLVAPTLADDRVVVDSATPLMAGHDALAKRFM